MPIVSKKLMSLGETYRRFLERNERREIRMVTTLKKKDSGSNSKSNTAVEEKPSKKIKTPVPPDMRDGDRYGTTWGLKLNETFIKLMIENEDPKKGHKDDEQLMQFLAAEFPNRPNRAILYNVREIRWRYNFGRLHLDEDGKPQPPSLRANKYDEDGNVYEKKKDSSTGMTDEERAMKIEDRRKAEVTRRESEDEKIAKSEERHQKFLDKINNRRMNWEGRNGPLQTNQPVAKEKKKFKKA